MKKLFQSHIPDRKQEKERVWKEALIVFDANTILNLYRYSDKSRTEFIALMKSIKNRIWTPEQAAHEYFKNRSGVIGDQAKAYEAAKKSIDDLRDALRKDRGHPFIREKTMDSLSSILAKVEGELNENKTKQISRIPSDDILTEIVNIFDGRVGEKLSNDELERIFEEGAERYEQKVPPGFRDASKHNNPTSIAEKRSVFGDLIVWKQTIAKAKELTKPVILVIDDAKDDWWLEAQGQTIGPRIELLDEFHGEVNQKFYMYRPDQFLKHAKEQLHSEISRETIDEIRATDENRLSTTEKLSHLNSVINNLILERIENSRNYLGEEIDLQQDYNQESNHGWLSQDRFAETQNASLADKKYYEIAYQNIVKNINDIKFKLENLSDQFNTVRNQKDFDVDEAHQIFSQQQDLRKKLRREEIKLNEVAITSNATRRTQDKY